MKNGTVIMTKVNFKNLDEKTTYKIGDMFTISGDSSIYILTRVAYNGCNFISLSTGNRLVDSFSVENFSNISIEEIEAGTGTDIEFFRKLKEVTIEIHE